MSDWFESNLILISVFNGEEEPEPIAWMCDIGPHE